MGMLSSSLLHASLTTEVAVLNSSRRVDGARDQGLWELMIQPATLLLRSNKCILIGNGGFAEGIAFTATSLAWSKALEKRLGATMRGGLDTLYNAGGGCARSRGGGLQQAKAVFPGDNSEKVRRFPV